MLTPTSTSAVSSSWRWPLAILFCSWLAFCLAAAFDYSQGDNDLPTVGFILAAVLPLIALKFVADARRSWWPAVEGRLADHTDRMDALPQHQLGWWIALAAGLGLYLELVIIRFHGSCFAVFGFFKNVSLLSCFLGLGIGYALGSTRLLMTPLVIPALGIELIAMHLLRYTDVGDRLQNPVSEQLNMGMGIPVNIAQTIAVYAFIAWSFSLNAICFVPLGQLASRLMGRTTKLAGYSWNLLGSIAAVIAFWGLSFLWTGPVVWFGVAFVGLAFVLRRMLPTMVALAVAILGVLSYSPIIDRYDIYSPYQILTVMPNVRGHPIVDVNHSFYQNVANIIPGQSGPDDQMLAKYYDIPYEVCPHPRDVLVVGSGTGNDVMSAVLHGARHVDAVEIDPAILQLGRRLNLDRPYDSDRVTAHVQDARAFIRYTSNKYDLIVYGLLDSHTALSGLSGVRLDSYVYTVQAFRDARAHLKDDGMLCMSFVTMTPSLAKKLYVMLQEAFDGQAPRVYDSVAPTEIFVIGKTPEVHPLTAPGLPEMTGSINLNSISVSPSTDDWPFFYMPSRRYPVTYMFLIAMLLAISLIFLRPVLQIGGGRAGSSSTCFLLGAGFMLLETKAITELALFYGSTWIVVSIVILSILIMAFFANLLIMRWPKFPVLISYPLLLAALALSLWFSTFNDTMSGQWSTRILATAVITLPLLFSGLVFSREMDSAQSVAAAFGSNLIGAMLGGCLEYNSMYFGYRSLYVVAMVIYGTCMVLSLRSGHAAKRSN